MPSSTIAAKARTLPAGVYCPVISLYKNTPLQEIDLDAMVIPASLPKQAQPI